DRQHRHPRAMAIEEAVDEVKIAGPAAPGADHEIAGQLRLGAGRECGDLSGAAVYPVDLALAADRIGQAVEAVADDAVDPLDARRGQRVSKLIGDSSHDLAPAGSCCDSSRPSPRKRHPLAATSWAKSRKARTLAGGR